MALPGTLSCQLAAPLTQWDPQLELPRTAGPRPTFLMSILPRLSLTPHFLSLKPAVTPRIPLPGSPTGGTYLPLLGGWTTSRTGHKHGAAGESWLVLARRSEQQLTQRAPWPRLLPASPPPPPGAQKGPLREIGATQRAAASSRQGRQSHTPRLASLTNVTAIGLFLL